FHKRGEQRIHRAAETQVDDLWTELDGGRQRLGKRERVAARGIGVRLELPACLQRINLRRGSDANNAEAIVGERRDDTRDFGAVAVRTELRRIVVDVVAGGCDAMREVRVLRV